jgi:Rad3-related DNA helicase
MRDKQAKCFDFIYRMLQRGIRDIVISAPTGVGKSAVGTTLGFWAAQQDVRLAGLGGAYYLCTQKLLQDQLEQDITRYPPLLRSAVSLKTASEYECAQHGNCGAGLGHKPICAAFKAKCCTYSLQKRAFLNAEVGITNYPYFFTERTYAQTLGKRKLLIADECHSLEGQLFKFIELQIGQAELDQFTPTIQEVPVLPTLGDFQYWLDSKYLPVLKTYLDIFDNKKLTIQEAKKKKEIENQVNKVNRAIEDFETFPENWVYWQEETPTTLGPERTALAKPLSAARYFRDLVDGTSEVRIYMSAYPGSKDVFCRTLGLDPTRVAMLSLGSVFPKENRPIHVSYIGSMSKRNQPATLPSFLRCIGKIMDGHGDQKGIIHCNSYALGTAIHKHFERLPQGKRIFFPKNANEREAVYEKHRECKEPSVILSPSFTEGFDFANDLARWQVIAKIPFPYLGDRQVAAKKEQDPEWYALRTVTTIVQASGRICRSETDHGTTYITDSDFDFLWDKYEYMFPRWWTEALNWH